MDMVTENGIFINILTVALFNILTDALIQILKIQFNKHISNTNN